MKTKRVHVKVNPIVRDLLYLEKGEASWSKFLKGFLKEDAICFFSLKDFKKTDFYKRWKPRVKKGAYFKGEMFSSDEIFYAPEVFDLGGATVRFWDVAENSELQPIELDIELDEQAFTELKKVKNQFGGWAKFLTKLAKALTTFHHYFKVAEKYPKLPLKKELMMGILDRRRFNLFLELSRWGELTSCLPKKIIDMSGFRSVDEHFGTKLECLMHYYRHVDVDFEGMLNGHLHDLEFIADDPDMDMDPGKEIEDIRKFAYRMAKYVETPKALKRQLASLEGAPSRKNRQEREKR